ncbi:MAG: methionine--tRNA ligase [Candidatus Neptunochlamydia sp.]|nr:methionine--tRNA ligase [Candidatus Neptunochlamydia sp.]
MKVLITAALPYANGSLHFGHIAGAYLPADCYARFQRLIGNDVLYICGSDEHGVAITLSAELAGRTPKEHVDHFHQVLKAFFQKMEIDFDHYSRTTWEGHVEPSQTYFKQLLKNGYIEEKVTNQLYSEKDQRFFADRYVMGICPKCGFAEARGDECPKCGASYEATDLKNPRSKLTGASLNLKATKHWFIRFNLFKDELSQWIKKKNWKSNVVNFAQNYIDDLRPRAITRDSDWGIPVPLEGAEGKVLYVWFDAPIGYISATKEWALKKGNPEAWKEYWCDEKTKLVNFIGKDNIPFHAIFFPAMTMGQDEPYKTVDELPANEFYNLEGKQFSKSAGWYINLEEFFKHFSADQIRYAIAANAPETQDSEFSWKDFQMRCNSELLGKYGNLINRVLVFTQNKCDGVMPPYGDLKHRDEVFLQTIDELTQGIYEAYSHFHLRKATQLIMELAQEGNVYFDMKKPWKDPEGLNTTMACCLRALNALALISFPIIPDTAEKVWKLLGNDTSLKDQKWEAVLETGIPLNRIFPKPEVLFSKVEDSVIEKQLNALKEAVGNLKDQISFDAFQKLDIRVAEILSVEEIPKSDKLYKIEVNLGFEKRIVVSGIRKAYPNPDALLGKKVAFTANLKPTRFMGIESQGMILAAGNDNSLEVVEIQGAPLGSPVA